MSMKLEIPYYPADVLRLLGAQHMDTLSRCIKSGKVPVPDVRISQKIRYWHESTLIKAGLLNKRNAK
jgi:hypothetical protein